MQWRSCSTGVQVGGDQGVHVCMFIVVYLLEHKHVYILILKFQVLLDLNTLLCYLSNDKLLWSPLVLIIKHQLHRQIK